jgi:DNA-binding protein HU-beta
MAKKATPTTITLKHLAAAIADEQELSKKQAETILNDLVGRITKHLKKGERIRIVGLGILQVRKRAARMAAIPPPGKQSTSRPARRWLSARPRNSRKPSDPNQDASLQFSTGVINS